MAKVAARGFNKVMNRCPHCGSRRPKELVEGPRRLNVALYLVVGALTCGASLIFFPLFMAESLEAYCDECGDTFAYR